MVMRCIICLSSGVPMMGLSNLCQSVRKDRDAHFACFSFVMKANPNPFAVGWVSEYIEYGTQIFDLLLTTQPSDS